MLLAVAERGLFTALAAMVALQLLSRGILRAALAAAALEGLEGSLRPHEALQAAAGCFLPVLPMGAAAVGHLVPDQAKWEVAHLGECPLLLE
jgi:hypothetical protein